jgi:PAS domain-containing protein
MLAEMDARQTGNQRLQMLFEHSPVFMAVLEGEDHKIVLANNAFVDLVGPWARFRNNPPR